MLDLCSIRKIQSAIRKFEETLQAETGLTLNEAMCLCAVSKGRNDPGTLAKDLELSPSRLTRVLDALEARKFVSRSLSNEDRRSISVALTRQGKAIIDRYQCAEIPVPEALAFTQK